MILGISASGRKDGVTSEAVKAVLVAIGLEYEYVSLAGKTINGCIRCTRCASLRDVAVIQSTESSNRPEGIVINSHRLFSIVQKRYNRKTDPSLK